ncbi:MAG: hypothetical protein K0R24_1943 [Gammaproteobacteria bacterium]|nr:hypothetical protein [Gammaproteobacteria bacterium]
MDWQDYHIGIIVATEVTSTIVTSGLTAGFILTAFGVLQASVVLPILTLLLLSFTGFVSASKIGHAVTLQGSKKESIDEKYYGFINALRNKEIGLGIFFSAATAGASVVTIYPTASAFMVGFGILHPGATIVCVGFVLDAIKDFYTDCRYWRLLKEHLAEGGFGHNEEEKLKEEIKNAKKLLLFSFFRLAGWFALLMSSFAFFVSCAPQLAAIGLISIAGSCLYNTYTTFRPTLFGSTIKKSIEDRLNKLVDCEAGKIQAHPNLP